jgi:hypothetical protein
VWVGPNRNRRDVRNECHCRWDTSRADLNRDGVEGLDAGGNADSSVIGDDSSRWAYSNSNCSDLSDDTGWIHKRLADADDYRIWQRSSDGYIANC